MLQYPLPSTVCSLIKHNTHPGLALDKYVKSWDPDLKELGKLSEKVQKPTIQDMVRLSRQWGGTLGFGDFLTRWQKTLADRGCFQFEATTVGPLTLHLARASALENAGICLHPIYGFVHLPGTGLKGMARAYAERIWLPVQPDPGSAWQKIEEVFGWAPHPDRTNQIADKDHPAQQRRLDPDDPESPVIDASCGQVIFYDAWPTTCPSLVEDILNNHHASYYQDQEPPGDWDSPVPVYFLAVPAGQTFLFALGKRRFDTPEELVQLAAQWLMGALEYEGAGAKTATGYGAFKVSRAPENFNVELGRKTWEQVCQKKRRAQFKCNLELVTPAFLAGAEQFGEEGKASCDLRPATLRGLLRWWWRTMHAAHVDTKTLAAMEAAVWGDTSTGGSVRITVRRLTNQGPILYDKEKVAKDNNLRIPNDPSKKTTQGLWYYSFGMDDVRKDADGTRRRFQRSYLPARTRWEITLTARPYVATQSNESANNQNQNKNHGKQKEDRDTIHVASLGPEELLRQAEAALWLFSHFGGMGSKSRKGFGSVDVPKELADLSVDQCQKWAEEFRRACRVGKGRTSTPALEDCLAPQEISVPWVNEWLVLDCIGMAAQQFAKQYKHNLVKKSLGLPRKIGAPQAGNFKPGPHVEKTDRHASPVHYHVARQADGKGLIVRWIAFPSPELPKDPTAKKSREFLEKLFESLEKQWKALVADPGLSSIGNRPGKYPSQEQSAGPRQKPATSPAATPALKSGDRVVVTIVEDPKGKGRLFAKHQPTQLVGPIIDPKNIIQDRTIGRELEVLVHSVNFNQRQIQFKPLEDNKEDKKGK